MERDKGRNNKTSKGSVDNHSKTTHVKYITGEGKWKAGENIDAQTNRTMDVDRYVLVLNLRFVGCHHEGSTYVVSCVRCLQISYEQSIFCNCATRTYSRSPSQSATSAHFCTPAPANFVPEGTDSTIIRHYPPKLLQFLKSDFRFLLPTQKNTLSALRALQEF
ncbi:hypothetical protein TNCV_205631 [Trichonephila clavipes]|nr:hypothetical protein TNCV_205631 [Trichonephila clavipes]